MDGRQKQKLAAGGVIKRMAKAKIISEKKKAKRNKRGSIANRNAFCRKAKAIKQTGTVACAGGQQRWDSQAEHEKDNAAREGINGQRNGSEKARNGAGASGVLDIAEDARISGKGVSILAENEQRKERKKAWQNSGVKNIANS